MQEDIHGGERHHLLRGRFSHGELALVHGGHLRKVMVEERALREGKKHKARREMREVGKEKKTHVASKIHGLFGMNSIECHPKFQAVYFLHHCLII